MNIDQFRPECKTCRFGHRNVASFTRERRIGCEHVNHELQPDTVQFTDQAIKYRTPSSPCGIRILTSAGDFTPGYWPNRRETVRLTVAHVIKTLLGNNLEGHRF